MAIVEETTASMNQVNDAITNSAEILESLNDKSNSLIEMNKQNNIQLRDMACIRDSVVEKTDNMMRKIEMLSGVSDNVDTIVGSIAEQTNLLALNASIESARAGEHGSGFYRLKGDEIPIMAQIINFADSLDNQFVLKTNYKYIKKYLELKRDKWFSSEIIDAFYRATQLTGFYMDLQDELVVKGINRILSSINKDMNSEEVRVVTRVFSKIIDYKSKFTSKHSQGLSEKIGIMSDYYNKDHEEKMLLLIAADLHDIGKLTISNDILDKAGSLDDKEFKTMRTHSYYTRVCLESIVGFEKITSWASNHYEKLDGSGYPYGLNDKYLDFNSRLMGCVDVYQALTENRPYRDGFSHNKSMDILNDMGSSGLIDQNIINDIELVFGNKNT